jgi:hypothetical protein
MRAKKGKIPHLTPQLLQAGGKQIRLRTVANVRSYLATLMRALKDGTETDIDKARVMIYACKVMSDLITGATVEERIDALESRQQPREEAQAVVQ